MKINIKKPYLFPFENAASSYQCNANVQKDVAKDLSKLISPHLFPALNVLEIGSGTGILTTLILEEEKHLNLTCLDFSSSMINELGINLASKGLKAARLQHLDMDQDLPKEKYDLAISSSCLHWSLDLNNLFKRLRKRLSSSGQIFFSMMVQGTFKEIEESISKVKDLKFGFDYKTKGEVITALSIAGFDPTFLKETDYFEYYDGFRELMKSLKGRGVSKFRVKGRIEQNSNFLLPKEFVAAEEFYENNYKASKVEKNNLKNRVYARYRVLTCGASLLK